MDLIPGFAFIFTIITSLYLTYTVKRIGLGRKVHKLINETVILETKVTEDTRDAVGYYEKARRQSSSPDDVKMSADLKVCYARYYHSSSDDPRYFESLSKMHSFAMETEKGTPVTLLPIVGLTAFHNKTEAISDLKGMASLVWQDESDFLSQIRINGNEFTGPFESGGFTKLTINHGIQENISLLPPVQPEN